MASAPDTMVVYKPSGSKRIEEGKVVGRLGYSRMGGRSGRISLAFRNLGKWPLVMAAVDTAMTVQKKKSG